jgi:predicted transcriptional regulator
MEVSSAADDVASSSHQLSMALAALWPGQQVTPEREARVSEILETVGLRQSELSQAVRELRKRTRAVVMPDSLEAFSKRLREDLPED